MAVLTKTSLVAVVLFAIVAYYLVPTPHYATEPADEYDFVVVGGGTAGCLIAAELAMTNPEWTVLLLEAGNGVRHSPMSEQSVPGAAADNVGFGNIDWQYQVQSQVTPLEGSTPPGFKDRSYPIPRGRGLGGSNELNYMLHVRGTPGDYAVWETATGDSRWGAESMAAAERKYEEKITFGSKAAPADGSSPHAHPLADTWVQAAGESPFGNTSSYNDLSKPRDGGFHYEHATIRGVRQSTARQFLLPALEAAANLDVVVGATVARLTMTKKDADGDGDGFRATGVVVDLAECRHNSISIPVLGQLVPSLPCLFSKRQVGRREVRARKEVVLSAGAYNSPHTLLKSGIGPAEELKQMNIQPLVDLPGVGKHLQDHPIVGIKYRLGPATGSWLPKTVTKLWLAFPSMLWSYLSAGKGMLSSSACDIGYFGATNSTFVDRPDLQVHGMLTAGNPDFFRKFLRYEKSYSDDVGTDIDYSIWAQGVMVAPTLLHSAAEGYVGLNPLNRREDGSYGEGAPIINYEIFDNDDDVQRTIGLIRRIQVIMAQPAMAAWEPELLYARSLAAEFGEDTDKYWEQYLKRFGFVVYHPTGTCAMGKRGEPKTVVDSTLRVIGVEGLRVADASIMPDIVSANTQVPTAAIAVQMVDILRSEYGK